MTGAHLTGLLFLPHGGRRELAEQSKQAVVASGRFDGPIVTPIIPASTFYEAEEYHQDYHKKTRAITNAIAKVQDARISLSTGRIR